MNAPSPAPHGQRFDELLEQVRDAAALARTAEPPIIVSLADLAAGPGPRDVSFTASCQRQADQPPSTRAARVCIDDGSLQWLSEEGTRSRLACWTDAAGAEPQRGALLTAEGDAPERLAIVDAQSRRLATLPLPAGRVESLQWSPDGALLLMRVAEAGADNGGASGGTQKAQADASSEPWRPQVNDGLFTGQWRRAFVLDLHDQATAPAWPHDRNVWELCWCGSQAIAALVSEEPTEDAWYEARIEWLDRASGATREVFRSKDQIAWLCASPSGRWLALVEGLASDRELVAGRVVIVDPASGEVAWPDTRGVDVTRLHWTDDDTLTWCGLRGQQTVLGRTVIPSGQSFETWVGTDAGLGMQWLPDFTVLPSGSACAVVSSFTRRPLLALFDDGAPPSPVMALGSAAAQKALDGLGVRVEPVCWPSSADGLPIEAWLLRAGDAGPAPLAVEVHGGPAWATQPRWLGGNLLRWQLLSHGHALLLPNPRGSVGRGRAFAARVYGDPGGADALDLESGVDFVVDSGAADPARLYVYGVSYGGYMSAWLLTRSRRFAAGMACSPVTHWASQQFTCQIPSWLGVFLGEEVPGAGGLNFSRSPLHAAAKVDTPLLLVCGALDRNTPPTQALEMYQALRLLGKPTRLLTYPQEGHGIRGAAATIDYTARVLEWFMGCRRPAGVAAESEGLRVSTHNTRTV